MKNTSAAMTLDSEFCHQISAENYFLSPKMPVKDHSLAFRATKTSFKPEKYSSVVEDIFRRVRECWRRSTSTRHRNLRI